MDEEVGSGQINVVEKLEAEDKPTRISCVVRASSVISEGLERFFFNLGFAVASRPWTVVMCTFFVSALFGLGMIRFELKDSSQPIWIPEDSHALKNQEWVEKVFPVKYRYNVLIITADNILDPAVIKQMYEIDLKVKMLSEANNSKSEKLDFNWTTICIKVSDECWSSSILELWKFDEEEIKKIDSSDQIVEKIAATKTSPVYNFEFVPADWLGDIWYDGEGKIVGAKAAKMLYVLHATSTNEFDNKILGPDLLWETKFIELGKKLDKDNLGPIQSVDVSAVRSFRDESDNSFEGDVMLLLVGVGVIVAYVAIILGKFNEVEHKVYLALVGVFGIGLASLVSYGFASAIGMFYGPIHPILPFLLLGLGVDDMFVIIEAWNNLNSFQKKNNLNVKVAYAMQHAGVSITVTSLTDFVAFAIGGSTTLPALKSFCVYAALGILSLFIIQSTFFVAWLTIDQRRQDASRDACCIWIKYVSFEPNRCSKRLFLPWFLRKFASPFLISLPIKVLIISLLIGMLTICGYGTYLLRTESDLSWFLPTDSYFARFLETQEKYFGTGLAANLYVSDIDYFKDNYKLGNLTAELESSKFVRVSSLTSWHSAYNKWLGSGESQQTAAHYGVELTDGYFPKTDVGYYKLLNAFVGYYQPQYYKSVIWNDTSAKNYREVKACKISFVVKDFAASEDDTAALEFFEELCERYFGSKAFVWAISFRNWETNRVIRKELYTNVGLAFAAVFIVTIFLVANFVTCIFVCTCVVFTLVNVCGFMHFWGLTIDTLTSILLILSIGLAIDYSAHVGHTFMTIHGSRNERARRTITTIGPAVLNGGFSTFLAFILLATSNSYVFTTFFKVFFLVVIFGLFNGLCVLPVLLSWFGPLAYLNARSGVALVSHITAHSITGPLKSTSYPAESAYRNQPPAIKFNATQEVVMGIDGAFPPTEENDGAFPPTEENNSLLTTDKKRRVNLENIELKVIEEVSAEEKPLTCDDIVESCEEYLRREQK